MAMSKPNYGGKTTTDKFLVPALTGAIAYLDAKNKYERGNAKPTVSYGGLEVSACVGSAIACGGASFANEWISPPLIKMITKNPATEMIMLNASEPVLCGVANTLALGYMSNIPNLSKVDTFVSGVSSNITANYVNYGFLKPLSI
jgi:hypothetical protein